ncbi:hypothetical protein ACB092_05G039400 [Castanea dentata]
MSLANSHFLPLLILRLCPLRQRVYSSIPDYALVTRSGWLNCGLVCKASI